METIIADLKPHDLEEIITDVIDPRMQVWLTQLLDAMGSLQQEE